MKSKKEKCSTEKVSGYDIIHKIIYFDKETIRNILQEYDKGNKSIVKSSKESADLDLQSQVSADMQFKLNMPLLLRIKFLFSNKISSSYISKFDSITTISSTEISEFEKIKNNFFKFEAVSVSDIENSSTFFRVAGNYIRILRGGVKGVDANEFKNVMEGYEGYDLYKLNGNLYESTYVRFNTSAFVSNYKRNDLLNSKLELYCIYVGQFPKSSFNFIEQLNKMSGQANGGQQTLDNLYPAFSDNEIKNTDNSTVISKTEQMIKLYDVVYAAICPGVNNENI